MNSKTHLKVKSDNVALPEVQVVEDEEEGAEVSKAAETTEEKAVDTKAKKQPHTHINYDNLAVPEIFID